MSGGTMSGFGGTSTDLAVPSGAGLSADVVVTGPKSYGIAKELNGVKLAGTLTSALA
jgi:hypothetical protein